MSARHFEVRRGNLRECRVIDGPGPEAGESELVLKVDRFAFTANNVTYAVFGDAMAYWNFFPAEQGWGRVPVWGFADVAQSRVPGIEPGERLYGYLPMSTHLVVRPAAVSATMFADAAPHRAQLPAPYQQYRRCNNDPGYAREFEAHQAILFPLYATSFLIDDFLGDHQLFGARRVVIASASSKTALALGFELMRNHGQRCEIVGLTSPGKRGFCESTGYYHRVLGYDQLAELPAGEPAVYVDMAGDGDLLSRVHHHFRDSLVHSCIVGATHWEQRATQHALPGAKPQFFFAPDRIRKRSKDWGPSGVGEHIAQSWRSFVPAASRWLKVQEHRGAAEIERVYREVLEGKAAPDSGHMLGF